MQLFSLREQLKPQNVYTSPMIGLAKLDNRKVMAKFPAEISLMTPGEINMKKGMGKGGGNVKEKGGKKE